MLREVHYLEIRGEETIPESAAVLYGRNDTLRKYVANLDLTVQWYNKVRETVIEVEYPLVEGQLNDIDAQLERAEKELNWNGEGMCPSQKTAHHVTSCIFLKVHAYHLTKLERSYNPHLALYLKLMYLGLPA